MKSNCFGVLHLLLVSGWDAYPSQATIKEQIRGKYCGAHKSSFLFFFLKNENKRAKELVSERIVGLRGWQMKKYLAVDQVEVDRGTM